MLSLEERARRSALLSTLMEQVGYAVWQVQALEDAAAHYLVVRVRGSKGMGQSEANTILNKAQTMTFGRLVRELTAAGVLERALADRLTHAVGERNWLVHQARRETHGLLVNETLYASLLHRTTQLSEEALTLQQEVGSALEAFVLASGLSKDDLDREAAAIARSWGMA
jgi:uncharacterized protein YutE (UPF0331/DUF86 family)